MARRQYQVGPTVARAVESPGVGWWVLEEWGCYNSRGEYEDCDWYHGPFDTKTEASLVAWQIRRDGR